MANIKFSAFTQKVVTGNVDFLVGYTGGDNVRISPAIFSDTYLPLAGGVMTGTLNLNDNVKAIWGGGSDLQIYHDASHSFISEQGTGSLITLATDYQLNNSANTQNMITASDGGAVTLFTAGVGKLATNSTGVVVTGNVELPDDGQLQCGNLAGGDLKVYYVSGVGSYVLNKTDDLRIMNQANDKDIIFETDDGTGSTTPYMTIDGGAEQITIHKNAEFQTSVQAQFGSSGDMQLWHDGGNGSWQNDVGHMYIRNTANDKSIYFLTDDGAGGYTNYIVIDGVSNYTQFDMAARFMDNVHLQFGNSNDAGIYHNGTDMLVTNYSTDGDMNFRADDGAGSVTNYFHLDGGVELTRFSKGVNFGDNVKLSFGDVAVPGDLEIYHDTSNSYIRETGTGNMYIQASERIRFTGINDEALLYLNENSNVEIYYDAALKFETTATGTKTTGQMDIAALNTAPASASAAGTLGEIRYTADYIYVCTATNTWKRTALSTW
jgi:hypothetical protein